LTTSKNQLKDKSAWLWLISEQTDFPSRQAGGGEPEREERAEGLDSSQRGRRLSEQESWRKLDTVGSITSTAADQQCHEK